jgi:hypothetical protein
MLNPDRVDWDEFSFGGEVGREIAAILGWRRDRHNDLKLWDTVRKRDTPYYTAESGMAPGFDPFNDLEAAIYAAGELAIRRRALFTLVKDRGSKWRAGFRRGEKWDDRRGEHRFPHRAVCMAILNFSRLPDHEKMFPAEYPEARR